MKPNSRGCNGLVDKYIGTAYDNVKLVADNIDDVNTVADTLKGFENLTQDITTVANNIDDVVVVSTDIINVNEVAGSITDVNNVSNNILDVNTVSENISNVNTVSSDIASVNTLSTEIGKVNIVADNIGDIGTVATNISDINILEDNMTDINTVSTNIDSVLTVEQNLPDILFANDNIADIQKSKEDMVDINTFVESSQDDFIDNTGSTRKTLTGIENVSDLTISTFNSEAAAAILEMNKSRGFRVVGAFADGFTYELFNDVGIDANGNSWIYVGAGAPSKVVSAGTVPSAPDYEQVSFNAASNVTDSRGTNVQDYIDGNLTPFKNVADMKASAYLSTLPEFTRVEWQGYYTQSDGGSNWGVLRFGAHTQDGGSIFSIDANTYIEANLKGNKINIRKFGAVSDSNLSTLNTNNAPKIQSLVDYLSTRGGGHIYTPAPQVDGEMYGIAKPASNRACVTVTSNNFVFSGDGASSIWKIYDSTEIPLHFSSDPDYTHVSALNPFVSNFEVYGMHIKGTGVYLNGPLAEGRGILFRNAQNVSIHDNTITDMSMIGICAEGGDGYFKVQNNQIHNCRYTGVNYNGGCYQSIVSGNIVSGCNGDPNSIAIQCCGHSIIVNNTIYGEIGNTVNCGGIYWGEGNYDGIGTIANNLIKHVNFGIIAIFHGSCNIQGNTIINALNRGAIIASDTKTASFTVENSNNIISSNLIINCSPYGINCSSKDTIINGNKIRTFDTVTNPSARTEPSWIEATTTAQGIRIRGEGCSVTNNHVSGCVRGLSTTINQKNAIIGGNTLLSNTHDYSLESKKAGVFVASGHAIIEREQVDTDTYRERIARLNLPTQGFFEKGSQWDDPTPSIGQPFGQRVLFANNTSTVNVSAIAGDDVITLDSTTGIDGTGVGSIIGIELDNGNWHWTTVVSVSSPTITLSVAIPSGRSVSIGSSIAYCYFRPLANIT